MKSFKSEKGYALVLVLLIVVFIMIISAVFMRGSISNAKQERIVDRNNLAYVAAEMGVDYAKWFYINRYEHVKQKLLNNRYEVFRLEKHKISSDGRGNKQARIEAEAINQTRLLVTDLERELRKPFQLPVFNLKQGYKYQETLPSIDSDILKYQVIVAGTVKVLYPSENTSVELHKSLDFELLFNVPEIKELASDGSNSEEVDTNWLENKELPKVEKPKKDCPSSNITNAKCFAYTAEQISASSNSTLYFKGNASKENSGNIGSKDFHNSIVYVDGEIQRADKSNKGYNINGAINLNFIVNGNSNFKNFKSFTDGSFISNGNFIADQFEIGQIKKFYIGGELLINDHSNIKDSTMLIGNDFKSFKDVTISNSTVVISDNFVNVGNGNKVNISGNSKVCVKNDFLYSKSFSITSPSKLYVSKDFKGSADLIAKGLVEKVPENEVLSKCTAKGQVDHSQPPTWITNRPEIDVTYK